MVAESALEPFEFVVAPGESGERLDKVIAQRPYGLSRATVQRWIEEGRVLVDGKLRDSKFKALAGQRVRVTPAPPPASSALPENIPLEILFEDEHLLVIDKAAGLVVHPAAGHASGTLVNALLHHAQIEDVDGESDAHVNQRPGIVHRLDKDTSGVMVIAKTVRAREGLTAQFKTHSIDRAYMAITVGHPPAQLRIETLHGRHPTDRKRFTSKVKEGKRAITHVTTLERFAVGASLVECRLDTGRTHQIRVHLSESGWPILGDPVYGKNPSDPKLKSLADSLGRQALHAYRLGIVHPVTQAALRWEAPLPSDMKQALDWLRDNASLDPK